MNRYFHYTVNVYIQKLSTIYFVAFCRRNMAPPPSTIVSPVVTLLLRGLTFICLLISIVVLATNTTTSDEVTDFTDFYAYRYMMASGVIGIVHTVLQIAFTIYYLSSGNRFGGDGWTSANFYGDMVITYLLATGAAACFGLTISLTRNDSEAKDFLISANFAARLLFDGFIFNAISSVYSFVHCLLQRD
ncbi:hypothetical protein ACJIZ3_022367 [Penstemon smallii]|uniref:CASP-like protein n=1 Tax=Penstemon smallii TaxID=265156 RepID=A0ABD3TMD9_9LAMI